MRKSFVLAGLAVLLLFLPGCNKTQIATKPAMDDSIRVVSEKPESVFYSSSTETDKLAVLFKTDKYLSLEFDGVGFGDDFIINSNLCYENDVLKLDSYVLSEKDNMPYITFSNFNGFENLTVRILDNQSYMHLIGESVPEQEQGCFTLYHDNSKKFVCYADGDVAISFAIKSDDASKQATYMGLLFASLVDSFQVKEGIDDAYIYVNDLCLRALQDNYVYLYDATSLLSVDKNVDKFGKFDIIRTTDELVSCNASSNYSSVGADGVVTCSGLVVKYKGSDMIHDMNIEE